MEETTPKVSAPELEGVQDLDGSSNTGCSESELTDGQHERIALNRQKALALRRARVRTRPYDKPTPSLPESLPPGQPSSQPGVERLEDTRGGFLLDSSELEEAAIWQERHCGAALQDDGKQTPKNLCLLSLVLRSHGRGDTYNHRLEECRTLWGEPSQAVSTCD